MSERELYILWYSIQTLTARVLGELRGYVGNIGTLEALGWQLVIDERPKRRLGHCRMTRRTIGISRWILDNPALPEGEVRETLLHEVAHAIDFEVRGTSDHSVYWKRVARMVGAKPNRLARTPRAAVPAYKWVEKCPACGAVARRLYRRVKSKRKQRACGRCCRKHNGGQFDERFELIFAPAGSS